MEPPPLVGTPELGDVPTPDLVGASGHQLGLEMGAVAGHPPPLGTPHRRSAAGGCLSAVAFTAPSGWPAPSRACSRTCGYECFLDDIVELSVDEVSDSAIAGDDE